MIADYGYNPNATTANTNLIDHTGDHSSGNGPATPAVEDVSTFNRAMQDSGDSAETAEEGEGEMSDEQYDVLLKSTMLNIWTILAIAGP